MPPCCLHGRQDAGHHLDLDSVRTSVDLMADLFGAETEAA
jgi:hypothetical protein